MRKLILVTFIGAALSGCGGSGGDSTSPTPPTQTPSYSSATPAITESNLALYGDVSAEAGQSVGFAVTSVDGQAISQSSWQQLSGTAVDLLASHTQAVGFDVPEAGTYQFEYTATFADGTSQTVSFDMTAQASQSDQANIRLDHSATELGRVSLRVDSDASKAITSISWNQAFGPEPDEITYSTDTTNGPEYSMYFDAPSVSEDEILVFSATITYSDGTQASDDAYVVVKDTTFASNGYFPQSELYVTTDMIPYVDDSPYADVLADCVYSNTLNSTCSFNTLPLIGQETTTPTIDDILDRLVVSHKWMGDRFKEFLQNSSSSEDMLKLLRATNAIVISYEVRPSFYWAATGAIYLDAANFWRTPEERDTLNTAPDYRSDFGNDLRFGIYWRYLKDSEYYYPQPSLAAANRNSRDFARLEAAVSWLMYHELAHANDFFPSTSWANLSSTSNPLSYASNNSTDSDGMIARYPLASDILSDLAQVNYGGETATSAQKALTAEDGANEFKQDTAVSFYSYYTHREDYATMFERFMMLYRLGVSADVAVISAVNNPNATMAWAQRDRIADGALVNRADYAIARVLPELDVAAARASLPAPITYPSGASWYDYASLSTAATTSGLGKQNAFVKAWIYDLQQFDQQHRHEGHLPLPSSQ